MHPLTGKGSGETAPTVDDVRRRLGGRASTESFAGKVVQLDAGPVGVLGVVLFASGNELHVLTADRVVRKTTAGRVHAVTAEQTPRELAELGRDISVFASLREGHEVRYADPAAGMRRGTLVEKCRYGALVLREDESVLGVGFRKIWPLADAPPLG